MFKIMWVKSDQDVQAVSEAVGCCLQTIYIWVPSHQGIEAAVLSALSDGRKKKEFAQLGLEDHWVSSANE